MTRPRAYGNLGSMDRELATVRAIYAAFARRDVEGALEFVSEEIELFPYGTATRTGRSEPYRGHDGVREYFADAARVWEELTLKADDVRAAGSNVVVFGHVDGRVDGRDVRRRAVWMWEVREGLATAMRVNDLGEATPGTA
jgi:ketosteroid isomerase-like protein